jgi:hypothetical protein
MVELNWNLVSTKSAMFQLCMVMEAKTVDVAVAMDASVVMVGLEAVVAVVVTLVDVVDVVAATVQ